MSTATTTSGERARCFANLWDWISQCWLFAAAAEAHVSSKKDLENVLRLCTQKRNIENGSSSPSRVVYCICEEDETEREKPFFFFTYSSFMLSQSWQPCASATVWKMLRVSYICCEGMWPNFDTMCWWFETYKEETPRLLLDIVHLSRTPQKATDVKMPESRESRVWDSIEAARKADHVLLIVLLKWGQDSRNKSSRT